LAGLVGEKSNAAIILGANFSAGLIAGVISAGATCPLDVAKTRRQIEASVMLCVSLLFLDLSEPKSRFTHSSAIYYNYIRITHYQSFNAILLTCKLSTSSTFTSSTNLYLPYTTGPRHLPHQSS
jgi:hypothetical protein